MDSVSNNIFYMELLSSFCIKDLCKSHYYLISFQITYDYSAAQKPKSWVVQRTTHGESLGGPYFFWLVRDFYCTVEPLYNTVHYRRY